MKNKFILLGIPTLCYAFILSLLIVLHTCNMAAKLYETLYIVSYFIGILCFASLIYSIELWSKYDKNNTVLLCLIIFNIVYLPYYYSRINKLMEGKSNDKIKRNNSIIYDTIVLNIMFIISITYIVFYFTSIYAVISDRPLLERIDILYYPTKISVLFAWGYSIYVWYKIDGKLKHLILLILFNVGYIPIFYFKILKIINVDNKKYN